jgi:hypothetical protein
MRRLTTLFLSEFLGVLFEELGLVERESKRVGSSTGHWTTRSQILSPNRRENATG